MIWKLESKEQRKLRLRQLAHAHERRSDLLEIDCAKLNKRIICFFTLTKLSRLHVSLLTIVIMESRASTFSPHVHSLSYPFSIFSMQ